MNASGVLANGSSVKSGDAEFLFEVFAPTIFGAGELDLEVAYEDGEWRLVGLDEASEREICAEELVILGSPATQTIVPDDPAFGFLGDPGALIHVIPQAEKEGVIFLGIAGDEIESGVFEGDVVQLKLISTEGPGQLSLYAVDAFGNPEVFFNTADGISQSDVFPIKVGGHSHQNWGFTQPGVYKVALQASGILAEGREDIRSKIFEFTFELQNTHSIVNIVRDESGGLILRWDSELGTSYQLQHRHALREGEWRDEGDLISGTGGIIEREVSVMNDVESLFYRLWSISSATP